MQQRRTDLGTLASKIDGFVVGEGADGVEIDSEVFSLGNQTRGSTDITNTGQVHSFSLVIWRESKTMSSVLDNLKYLWVIQAARFRNIFEKTGISLEDRQWATDAHFRVISMSLESFQNYSW